MLTVSPPMLMFPVRAVGSEFTRASTLTVPFPGPLPETILIHGWLGVAVHGHAAFVVTVMSCAGDPEASNVRLPGATT